MILSGFFFKQVTFFFIIPASQLIPQYYVFLLLKSLLWPIKFIFILVLEYGEWSSFKTNNSINVNLSLLLGIHKNCNCIKMFLKLYNMSNTVFLFDYIIYFLLVSFIFFFITEFTYILVIAYSRFFMFILSLFRIYKTQIKFALIAAKSSLKFGFFLFQYCIFVGRYSKYYKITLKDLLGWEGWINDLYLHKTTTEVFLFIISNLLNIFYFYMHLFFYKSSQYIFKYPLDLLFIYWVFLFLRLNDFFIFFRFQKIKIKISYNECSPLRFNLKDIYLSVVSNYIIRSKYVPIRFIWKLNIWWALFFFMLIDFWIFLLHTQFYHVPISALIL